MKQLTRVLAALMMSAGATRMVSAAQLLVLEKGSNTLAVVDPVSLQIGARVPTGTDPHEVIASSDGSRAYVSNYGGDGSDLNIISVIDLTTRKALQPIDLGALHSAHGLDFQGGKLYFTAETNKVIGSYDPVTRRVDWVLGTGQNRTHMIIVTPDVKHIYTSNVASGTISIIELLSRTVGPPPGAAGRSSAGPGPGPRPAMRNMWEVTNVPSGRGSEGFDLSPDGKRIWAANAQDGTITIIDVPGKKALETFPVAVQGANRLKFTLDGRYVLVTGLGAFGPGAPSGGDNLVVLDATTHKPVKAFQLGGGSAGILLDPSGTRAFIAVNQGGKVAVIDLHSLEVSGQLAANQPDGMAWVR